jgi:chemotaxis protein CheD
VQVCKKRLKELSIAIIGEDTGSTSGRSVEFSCETGVLQVRTVSPGSIRLL